MRYLLLPMIVLLSAAAPLPPAAEDAKRIQGTWSVVLFEARGMSVPDEKLKLMTLEFKENVFILNDGVTPEHGTFKLDPSTKPKGFDATIKRGEKGEVALFIYELDGDNLKLCWRKPGSERPTAFTSTGTDGYMVLKRKK